MYVLFRNFYILLYIKNWLNTFYVVSTVLADSEGAKEEFGLSLQLSPAWGGGEFADVDR